MHAAGCDPNGHPAVEAWRELRGDGSLPQSLKTLYEAQKSAVYLLERVGGEGSGVIAKLCLKETAVVECAVYKEILPRLSTPTLRYYGHVAGEGDFCWLFVDDAGEREYSSAIDKHRLLAARWLGMMHLATAGLAGETPLPSRSPLYYLTTLRSTRRDIVENFGNPTLTADNVSVLKAIAAQFDLLESRWDQLQAFCGQMPQTLVHGDFKEENMRVRQSEQGDILLPFDWELAGWGTPAVDLARGIRHSGDAMAAVSEYLSIVRHYWPQLRLEDVRRLVSCGAVFRLIDSIAWERFGIIYDDWASRGIAGECARWAMHELGRYGTRLAEAVQAVQWSGEIS